MAQKHQHSHHSHHHHHHVQSRIGFAFVLNFSFAIVEMIGGLSVNSVAILSDALHDFGDAMALALAWLLEKKSRQATDARFSYGYRRYSTASAVISAIILVAGSILILFESVPRLFHPEKPNVEGMIALAFLGVAVNGFAFLKLKKGSSLNERVLSWHFIEDLMGWVLVLVGAIFMKIMDVPILDALMAICLSLWVLWNVVKNLKEALGIFLQAIPKHLSIKEVEDFLSQITGVESLHHTHLWSLDGETHIFTAHVLLRSEFDLKIMCELKKTLKSELSHHFGINEATFEFEWPGENCTDPVHRST